jgi:hypothetical protein
VTRAPPLPVYQILLPVEVQGRTLPAGSRTIGSRDGLALLWHGAMVAVEVGVLELVAESVEVTR